MIANLRPQRFACPSGFTLIETLIAMGVFAIGFVAVAAPMFVAVRIQSQTIDDVRVRQIERNAEAMLVGRKLEYDTVSPAAIKDNVAENATVQRFSNAMLSRWSLSDRSGPTSTTDLARRRYYWIPMIRSTRKGPEFGGADLNKSEWHFFIFVLRRGDRAEIPHVESIPVTVSTDRFQFKFSGGANDNNRDGNLDLIRPGDQVLDQYGQKYTVVDAMASWIRVDTPVPQDMPDPNEIWYATPPNDTSPSPIRSIRQISSNVVR